MSVSFFFFFWYGPFFKIVYLFFIDLFLVTLGPLCYTRAFSSCGAWAYRSSFPCCRGQARVRTSAVVTQGLSCPGHEGASQTRDRAEVPYIARRILNHWTTRDALMWTIFKVLTEFFAVLPLLFLFWLFGQEACRTRFPWTRDQPRSSCVGRWHLNLWAPGKSPFSSSVGREQRTVNTILELFFFFFVTLKRWQIHNGTVGSIRALRRHCIKPVLLPLRRCDAMPCCPGAWEGMVVAWMRLGCCASSSSENCFRISYCAAVVLINWENSFCFWDKGAFWLGRAEVFEEKPWAHSPKFPPAEEWHQLSVCFASSESCPSPPGCCGAVLLERCRFAFEVTAQWRHLQDLVASVVTCLHRKLWLIKGSCCCSATVMSNSLQRYGLQPPRLLCPWGFSRMPCPPPGDRPDSGIKPRSHALASGFFTIWATREALEWEEKCM